MTVYSNEEEGLFWICGLGKGFSQSIK